MKKNVPTSSLDLGTPGFEGENAIQYTTAAACQKLQIVAIMKFALSILLHKQIYLFANPLTISDYIFVEI